MDSAWRHLRELAPNGEGHCMEGCTGRCRESGSAPEEQQPL